MGVSPMRHGRGAHATMGALESNPNNPSPRIVIPIVAGIGNALLATPMVRRIKRAIPNCRITILARIDAMAEVFRRMPEVDETIVTGKGLRGIWKNISESRRRHPDFYLVPFPSNRWQYSLLALTSGAKRKLLHAYPVGYWRAMHFIGERMPAVKGIHDVRQNLNLLQLMNIEPGEPEAPAFELRDNDRLAADSLLRGIESHPIAVHAGSAKTVLARAKRWPAEYYAQLIDRLEEQFGRRIMLIEGPDERGVSDEILPHTKTSRPAVVRLTGPLGEAAAILQRSQLYVGSDSGLAHLAAAVGTPPVTIFAPADPERVCPFGYRHLVVQAATPCAPCFEYPWKTPYPKMCCREPFCIETVTVDAVITKAHEALAGPVILSGTPRRILP